MVAGAGSGKTETMAARVVYLVATGQVRPEQVLGLTFTRKAAAALSQRVPAPRLRMLGCSDCCVGGPSAARASTVGDPEVATYHSFGGRLIADFGPLAGVEPASRILTPTGAWQLARRVVGRWDGDLHTDLGPDQVTERLLAISGALADHLTDADALSAVLDDLLDCAALGAAGPAAARRRCTARWPTTSSGCRIGSGSCRWCRPSRTPSGSAASSISPTRCRSRRRWRSGIRGSGRPCGTSTGSCCSTSTRTPVTPSG